MRAPENKASPESHFTVWTPKLWIATLATTILLIVATRIMYKFGAFEETGATDSDTDTLPHLLQKQGRLGSGTLGICFLSVLGSICSEGKIFAQLRSSSQLILREYICDTKHSQQPVICVTVFWNRNCSISTNHT